MVNWKKKPRFPIELLEWESLCNLLVGFNLSAAADSWCSNLAADGKFYVHDLRAIIDSVITCSSPNPTIWLSIIPIKVMVFVWRACLDRIPTASNLVKRGVVVPTFCTLCDVGEDTTDHSLVSCPFAHEVLVWIFKWWDFPF